MSIVKPSILTGIVAVLGSLMSFSESAQGIQPAPAIGTEKEQVSSKPETNSAPPRIHYHYHYHVHAYSSPLGTYPGYDSPFVPGGPMTSFPLPQKWTPPTQAHPYPSWYLPGSFTAPPFENTSPRAPQDKGVIDVFLPVADAEVYLNGQKMRGTGKKRKLTTPLLPLDKVFQYYVTVRYQKDGEMVDEYRKVDVGAGEYTVADFTRPPLDNPMKLPSGPVDPNEVAPAGSTQHLPRQRGTPAFRTTYGANR